MIPKIFKPFTLIKVKGKQIFRHKIITGIILLLIISGGYFGYQRLTGDKNTVKYAIAAVEKGALIVSVSGSGQVSALDQIDVKSAVSGEIAYIDVKSGQEVKAGTLIAQLDTRDAQKAVWDAEINLADTELTLKNTKGKAEESLAAAYEDGLNVLTNTFKDLSPMMSDIKEMFKTLLESSYGSDESDIDYYQYLVRLYSGDSAQLSYWVGGAERKYLAAQTQFDAVQAGYWALSQSSPYDQIEIVLNQTYDTTRTLLELVQQTLNLIQKYQTLLEKENLTPPISIETSDNQVSQLSEFTSLLIERVDALSTVKLSLVDKKEAVAKADLDIETQGLTVKQSEYALSNAKETLSQHYIHVPFDGIIAEVNSDIKKGDSISANTVLATLITKQKIAEISLNEVDAAKVKIGQKATLTFDALPDLTISGKVLEVDIIGTVSQGVVSYGVKIVLDTDEEQIKPGMSITADIITDSKQDVLVVPNGAVKSQGNSHYVELVEASEEMKQQLSVNTSGVTLSSSPKSQSVEIGISNDLSTEIISGLKEGDIIVTSTISSNNAQTTQTQTNQNQRTQEFRIPGL